VEVHELFWTRIKLKIVVFSFLGDIRPWKFFLCKILKITYGIRSVLHSIKKKFTSYQIQKDYIDLCFFKF